MCLMCSVGYGAVGVGVLATSSGVPSGITADPAGYSSTREVISSLELPKIEQPKWLKKQLAAEKSAQARQQSGSGAVKTNKKIVVTYDVATRGNVAADVSEFKQLANQTLNDKRGWSRMGVSFSEVKGGGQFTLVLAEASEVPKFSPSGCSSDYSCRVGRYVIINEDRWVGATPSWNNAGGSLRDYRHMVVNHETGHWLGHGHTTCSGSGRPATVMQQQSINLQGCKFNAWPLESELWSTQLGIS